MSIKKVKPTAKSGFKQGYYKPHNPKKYMGPGPIIYIKSRQFIIDYRPFSWGVFKIIS